MRASVLSRFAVSKFAALALMTAFFSVLMLGCNDGGNPSTPTTYTLTTTAFPSDGGTISRNPNAASYDAGTRVTVTAEPAEGYEFDSWSVTGGTIADVDDEITQVTVNADITMTANFRAVVVSGPDTRWYTSDTTASTYTLFTADELAGLAQLVNAGNSFTGRTIVLGDDVDLSWYGRQNTGFNSGRGWISIGNWGYYNRAFAGTFDGGSNEISGLYINTVDQRVGLFGSIISGGTVKNLGLVGVEISGGERTGGLAGDITDGTVEGCYVTGTVKGGNNTSVGGLAGHLSGSNSAIRNSYSEATVSGGGSVGGLVGTNGFGGAIMNCYATGAVTGTNDVGGLVGALSTAIVSNSYAAGVVSGHSNVGGIVGQRTSNSSSASIIHCAALNPNIDMLVSEVGRVVGTVYVPGNYGDAPSVVIGSAAFADMTLNESPSEWRGIVSYDGEPLTIDDILADGTIGNRFRASNGWTVEPGKLPGLMGRAVDLPPHLR